MYNLDYYMTIRKVMAFADRATPLIIRSRLVQIEIGVFE